jgi:hypothetical protein
MHGATQNMGDDAGRHFQFTVHFFPSKTLLCDGSVRNIERNTIVRWKVEFREIDPQELHNMEERVVRNVARLVVKLLHAHLFVPVTVYEKKG